MVHVVKYGRYIKSGTSGSGGHNLSYLGRLQLSLLIKPNQTE